MKAQPLHVPVDCIGTLKYNKPYSWRDAITKCKRKMQVKTSNKLNISYYMYHDLFRCNVL